MIEAYRKVGVIGAGTMGNGIAHVFAQFGYDVILVDVSPEVLKRALETIQTNLDRQIKKGVVQPEEKERILHRIQTTTDLSALKDRDLVVEAVTENESVKQHIFQSLSRIVSERCLIATNTSSISITKLAQHVTKPERFVGMHFMNPVPVMKLVEVIKGYNTSDSVVDQVVQIARDLDKEPVVVNDYPGFVANRILMPMINEAIYALYEGVASKEAIDTVMKLGMNHPMGPLTLADFIGLDVCLAILNVLYEGFKHPKYAPCPLLVNMVNAGHLGRKTGKGFYDYTQS